MLRIGDTTAFYGRIAGYGGTCPVCGKTCIMQVHMYEGGRHYEVRSYHNNGACHSPPPPAGPPSCAALGAIGGGL